MWRSDYTGKYQRSILLQIKGEFYRYIQDMIKSHADYFHTFKISNKMCMHIRCCLQFIKERNCKNLKILLFLKDSLFVFKYCLISFLPRILVIFIIFQYSIAHLSAIDWDTWVFFLYLFVITIYYKSE